MNPYYGVKRWDWEQSKRGSKSTETCLVGKHRGEAQIIHTAQIKTKDQRQACRRPLPTLVCGRRLYRNTGNASVVHVSTLKVLSPKLWSTFLVSLAELC